MLAFFLVLVDWIVVASFWLAFAKIRQTGLVSGNFLRRVRLCLMLFFLAIELSFPVVQ